MDQIKLRALAKINLGLDVVRRREDGYHDVRMIMQTINLYDQLVIKKKDKPGISVKTNLYYLPVNENNLVYKAAKMLIDEFRIKQGVSIQLKKYIPVSAGMAGGSTDAAAALFGINRLFKLGLSREQLMQRGVKIGADVPYCLMRGTALAEGIGEVLTPLAPMPECKVLIVKPPISVSTKLVYTNLQADKLERHPRIDDMIAALEQQDLYQVADLMENVLEKVTIEEYPVIQEIKDQVMQRGAVNAMMSGSGPTVFGLYDDEEKARAAFAHFKAGKWGKQVYLTNIFNNGGKAK